MIDWLEDTLPTVGLWIAVLWGTGFLLWVTVGIVLHTLDCFAVDREAAVIQDMHDTDEGTPHA